MPGGLLNLISYGNQNIILNGNPSKTFFKTVYAKYSNFGVQKFQIDYIGNRNLQLNEDSTYTFKIPRNAELVLDTFLSFDLPNIWSPIMPPTGNPIQNGTNVITDDWKPYEFRWIDNIGTNIIKNVTLSIGGQIIQTFNGEYIKNLVERDLSQTKKNLFDEMTGMTPELTTPEYTNGRYNQYPNAFVHYNTETNLGPEPSIRGRKIYVPLHFWFSYSTKLALPLVCLQYSEVTIDITLRPICDLFTINDASITMQDGFTFTKVRPNFNNPYHALHRFLQPPPDIILEPSSYETQMVTWDANLYLIVIYCFLSEEEARVFAKDEQKYLIKDVKQDLFPNTTGTNRIKLQTNALVSSWMWYFKRSDAYLRNEWSNYSNWLYKNVIPYDVVNPPDSSIYRYLDEPIGPGKNIKYSLTYVRRDNSGNIITSGDKTLTKVTSSLFVTPEFNNGNIKEIMTRMSILFDGKYRENEFESGVYKYIEKYKMSDGHSDNGLYSYNFGLHTNPYDLQPSGAINLSKFNNIQLEFTTITPPLDPNASYKTICDINGAVIGTTNVDSIYLYDYDLYMTEERYNMVRFISGQAGLIYAR